MRARLREVAAAQVGAFWVDENVRNIPDHWHAHARPEGRFWDKPVIEAVVFDIGGVVQDSPLHAIARYERDHGLPAHAINRAVVASGETGAWSRLERGELTLRAWCAPFESDCRTLGVAVDAARLMTYIAQAGRARPQMLRAIARLRERGLRVGALTNNWATDDPAPRPTRCESTSTLSWSRARSGCASPTRACTSSSAPARRYAGPGGIPRRHRRQSQIRAGARHAHDQGGRPGRGAARAERPRRLRPGGLRYPPGMSSGARGPLPDAPRDREVPRGGTSRRARGITSWAAPRPRPRSGATARRSTPSRSARACCATSRRSTPRRPSSAGRCASR